MLYLSRENAYCFPCDLKSKNTTLPRLKTMECSLTVKLQKFFPFPGLVIFFIFIHPTVIAQEINEKMVSDYNDLFSEVIGLDENLINGCKYMNQFNNVKGHEFFGDNEFISGSLVLNNKTYTNVSIKYDILNQDIILSYKNSLQGINHIVLQKSLISEFELGSKHFEKLYFAETDTQFFQVISNEKIKCLYFWQKILEINPQSVQNYFEYSDQSKKTYLVINNDLKHYSSKFSFIRLFPEDLHKPIKAYFSKNKLNIKNASDESILKLIEFCEGLISEKNNL